ncbi:MAG: exo-alpha-sialidase [Verrucomicrobia bacterium]|nr:exo-alpha-sialidase [Verrucomicrobiota bacterium]
MKYHCLIGLLSASLLVCAAGAEAPKPVGYRLQLDVVSDGYDGEFCWFHPRAGAIPGPVPTVVLTVQKWWLKQSDVFFPVQSLFTTDLGKTWSKPVEHLDTLGRHPAVKGIEEGICDFTPKWHAKSGTLLGTGHTVFYENNKLVKVRPRATVWSVYEPKTHTWTKWQALPMPDEAKFSCAGAGSTQRVDLENGDILLPIYSKNIPDKAYFTTVVRCKFDGKELRYSEHGSELFVDIERGLYEPSLAKFGGKFFLTMRNDRAAYVAVSKDGLHFSEPRKWTFDDGTDLGSYNTQAHWVTHGDGLFLTYTRRGADNDHVARHRAPLFMAQIDPDKLVVRRATEKILVPNKGAQLGNFAVVDVSERETWVTTSEGMAPAVLEKYGANGRVYAARLLWEKPNRAWAGH